MEQLNVNGKLNVTGDVHVNGSIWGGGFDNNLFSY